ncbi:ankyrin-1-like [Mytilus trossulus]|uniref:ankyrin-1-like n=1 Tax=Mytilus trossulus TaxID=6551 RepID=UPI0030071326
MCSANFRKEMIPHFEKHLKAKNIVDAKDKSTVMHQVSSSGYTDLLAYFVQNDMPNINKQDSDGKTALHLAVLHRHQHIAEILLQQKADVHLRDSDICDSRSAIHMACNNGDLHMVDLLIKHAAHINKRDKLGFTPLHLASIRGHTEVVKLLAKEKAKAKKIDAIGRTALYVACEMNRLETVKFLLQEHTIYDIHIEESKNGFTPLHIACEKEHTYLVDTLLKYGANVNRPSKNNDTPMKIAKRHGNKDIIKLFAEI